MYSKLTLVIFIFLGVNVDAAPKILEETATVEYGNQEVLNYDIRFAGAIEGKAFWAVLGPHWLNWTEAGNACIQRNMKLAEITSLRQAQTIRSQYNATQYPCCSYWTAGRDARELRQFSWNSSNTDVSESGVELTGRVNLHGCLYFRVDTGKLQYRECDDSRMTRAYLCEIIIPIL